jgi:hypothetical protein
MEESETTAEPVSWIEAECRKARNSDLRSVLFLRRQETAYLEGCAMNNARRKTEGTSRPAEEQARTWPPYMPDPAWLTGKAIGLLIAAHRENRAAMMLGVTETLEEEAFRLGRDGPKE